MNEKPTQDYYTLTEIKQLGWTPKIIDELLMSPDEIKTNPIYKSASPMRLYRISRVNRG